jgi:hypothetical protein
LLLELSRIVLQRFHGSRHRLQLSPIGLDLAEDALEFLDLVLG